MVFGFDIDGVLTDDDNGQSNLWLERASAFFNRPILKHSFYIDEALGIAKEELEPFLVRETAMIMEIVSPRQGCVEVLTRLMDRGHEVQLITARSEPYREVTEDWLRRHKIPYTDLHMSPSEDQSYSKGQNVCSWEYSCLWTITSRTVLMWLAEEYGLSCITHRTTGNNPAHHRSSGFTTGWK